MFKLDVKGLSEVKGFLTGVQKQVAFAASRAINKTAIKVQEHEVNKELPGSLKLRTKWFQPRTKFGVNIRFSSKARLFATVGSQAPWLKLVEQGGKKLPPNKAIPVPTSNIDTSRRRKKREKPKAILATRRAFVATLKSGKSGIFVRLGRARLPIKAMYLFHGSTDVPDVLDFFESGRNVVNGEFIKIFPDELAKAIASVK
jgi:hypothetical protein